MILAKQNKHYKIKSHGIIIVESHEVKKVQVAIFILKSDQSSQ